MITKKDMQYIKTELKDTFATKDDLHTAIKDLVELIAGGFNRMDRALDRMDEYQKIQNNHGRRLDIIEDKVFA